MSKKLKPFRICIIYIECRTEGGKIKKKKFFFLLSIEAEKYKKTQNLREGREGRGRSEAMWGWVKIIKSVKRSKCKL